MVLSRAGNARRIFRVLPAAARLLAHLRLSSARRGPKKDLLQKRPEAGAGDRRQSLPKLKLVMCTPTPPGFVIDERRGENPVRELRRYPTPVFCQKGLDLLDCKGLDFFQSDKEFAIVCQQCELQFLPNAFGNGRWLAANLSSTNQKFICEPCRRLKMRTARHGGIKLL